MAAYRKRAGKYEVYWRDLAGDQRSRTCPSAKIAGQLCRDIEECLALGRDWQLEITGAAPDLEKLMEAYIDHRSLRLRKRTLERYAENLDIFVRFLRTRQPKGTLSVELMSKPLLEDYLAWLCKAENGLHGKKRDSDTARKIIEVAQLAWKWADESDRWPGAIPRPRRIEMSRKLPKAVHAPTWAEMDRCVVACRGWHKKLATFLRYTGLRVGESMLMVWTDVDMAAGTLMLREEIIKAGPTRVVPMSSHLLEELSTWGVREGWLIPSGRKKGQRERQARARDIARAWERAKVREIVWRGQPDHAFRKGIKSGLLNLGAREDAVDSLQGHSLGRGGARGRYIDPAMLRLSETVGMIPKIGATEANVSQLPRKPAAE